MKRSLVELSGIEIELNCGGSETAAQPRGPQAKS
jgi:hypothetical protein